MTATYTISFLKAYAPAPWALGPVENIDAGGFFLASQVALSPTVDDGDRWHATLTVTCSNHTHFKANIGCNQIVSRAYSNSI